MRLKDILLADGVNIFIKKNKSCINLHNQPMATKQLNIFPEMMKTLCRLFSQTTAMHLSSSCLHEPVLSCDLSDLSQSYDSHTNSHQLRPHSHSLLIQHCSRPNKMFVFFLNQCAYLIRQLRGSHHKPLHSSITVLSICLRTYHA